MWSSVDRYYLVESPKKIFWTPCQRLNNLLVQAMATLLAPWQPL